jgi:hypothetical protein
MATTATATSRTPRSRRPALSRSAPAVLTLLAALALLAPSAGHATDRTLKATLAKWSHVIAVDAHGIGLSAWRRHPRRMAARARHFRADALRARRAIAAQSPSTPRGRRGKRLALAAFGDYAAVGREWALSGQARVQRRTAAAVRHATSARRFSRKANRALNSASRLLR